MSEANQLPQIAEEVKQSEELSIGNDLLLRMAAESERKVEAINTIMKNALRVTTHLDWVNIGGNPYLQETGASKIARLFGVSWEIAPPVKEYDKDGSGHYTYRTNGKFSFAGAEIDAFGLRSTHDDFFTSNGKNNPPKNPQDVDERDVMQAAYTNCLGNGIKRIIPGLRNITLEYLKEAGIETSKINGYGFNSGRQTAMSEDAVNQKAEIERMLKDVYGDRWTEGLELVTSFTNKAGDSIPGKKDINKLSEKQMPITYKQVKEKYGKWVKKNEQQTNPSEATGGGEGEN